MSEVVAAAKAFHARSHWADMVAFDHDHATRQFRAIIKSDMGAIFLAPGGGLLMMVACPLHFSPEIVAQELSFCGPHGNALREAGEEWARQIGARIVLMGAEEATQTDVVSRWYRFGGYKPFGRSFVRAA